MLWQHDAWISKFFCIKLNLYFNSIFPHIDNRFICTWSYCDPYLYLNVLSGNTFLVFMWNRSLLVESIRPWTFHGVLGKGNKPDTLASLFSAALTMERVLVATAEPSENSWRSRPGRILSFILHLINDFHSKKGGTLLYKWDAYTHTCT